MATPNEFAQAAPAAAVDDDDADAVVLVGVTHRPRVPEHLYAVTKKSLRKVRSTQWAKDFLDLVLDQLREIMPHAILAKAVELKPWHAEFVETRIARMVYRNIGNTSDSVPEGYMGRGVCPICFDKFVHIVGCCGHAICGGCYKILVLSPIVELLNSYEEIVNDRHRRMENFYVMCPLCHSRTFEKDYVNLNVLDCYTFMTDHGRSDYLQQMAVVDGIRVLYLP